MIERLIEERRKSRLKYYKNLCVELSDSLESKTITGDKRINQVLFIENMRKFAKKYELESFYDDLVASIKDYWKENNVQHARYKKSFFLDFIVRKLTYLCLELSRWSCAKDNIEEIRTTCLATKLINFFKDGSKDIFTDFEELKEFFERAGLSKKEKTEMFIKIITLNNERFQTDDFKMPVNANALEIKYDKRFAWFKKGLIGELAKYNCLDLFMESNSKDLKSTRKKFKKVAKENPSESSHIKNICSVIAKGINSGSLNDLDEKEKILKCFEDLGFEELYQAVATKSARDYKQKINEEASNQNQIADAEPANSSQEQMDEAKPTDRELTETDSPKKNELSKKEKIRINRKLDECYDFNENKCRKSLSMDEIIECVAMLTLINADTSVIEKFIFVTEKELKQNPYVAYYQFIDKISSTVTDPMALEYLSELKELVEKANIFITDDESYKKFKTKANRCVRYINKFIDNDYSYEYNLAKEKVRELNYGESKKSM